MATLLKPMRLANPSSRRKKKMSAKQIKFFGTKRQKAALHRKRTSNAGKLSFRKLKKTLGKERAYIGHGPRYKKDRKLKGISKTGRRKNVGTIMIARRKNKGRRRRNVEMGFYNATGFHPIRKSRDYDSGRLFDDTEGSYRSSTRRKKSKSKRRKNPSMAKARRHRRSTVRARVTNRRRRAVVNRRHRRRSNPGAVYRRRRNSPKVIVRYRNRGHKRHHRRRNPGFSGFTGSLKGGFMRIGGLVAGAYVTRLASGFIPAQFSSGFIGYIATAAVAYLQGKVIGKLLKSPVLGQSMVEGGYVYLALRIAQDMGFGASLPFGLSGGRGMGQIGSSSFAVPQVNMRGSMGSFLPAGTPYGNFPQIASGLKGINNDAFGGGRLGQRRVGRIS